MASITIRDLDEKLKARLRIRAAEHSRSMEDEARDILRIALAAPVKTPIGLGRAIRERFGPLGGIELPAVPRDTAREPPDLSA